MSYSKNHAFSLSTHQFRVRHLQGIQVKNLPRVARTQIALVSAHTRRTVFQSQICRPSAYPRWSFQNPPPDIQSDTELIVQVWDTDERRLLIEHYVVLGALAHLPEQPSSYDPNTVIYQMSDSLFYSKHGIYPDIGCNTDEEVKKKFFMVRSCDYTHSYDTRTVSTLHDLCKGIEGAKSQLLSLRSLVSSQCTDGGRSFRAKGRVRELSDTLEKLRGGLAADTAKREAAVARVEGVRERCEEQRTALGRLKEDLAGEMENVEWKQKYSLKVNVRLLKRRQALLGQLGGIFEIKEDTHSRVQRIFNLGISQLLSSDAQNSGDRSSVLSDEETCAALGYTAHLVSIISHILDLPLRFPVTPALSQSTIRDDITAKLDEKRSLPLYTRGKDRSYFSYGVFLLYRNIVQLRFHCGLKTEDMKEPLWNLRTLLEAKLKSSMSCGPPVRPIGNDPILREFGGGCFQKTHKRARSAPVNFKVTQEMMPIVSPENGRDTPVASSSLGNSSHALSVAADDRERSASPSDVHLIPPSPPTPSSTAPTSPRSSPPPDPELVLVNNTVPIEPNSAASNSTVDRSASWASNSADSAVLASADSAALASAHSTVSGSSGNYRTDSTSGSSTLPRTTSSANSGSLARANSTAAPKRASFKSYIRGSDLWEGREELQTSPEEGASGTASGATTSEEGQSSSSPAHCSESTSPAEDGVPMEPSPDDELSPETLLEAGTVLMAPQPLQYFATTVRRYDLDVPVEKRNGHTE